MSHFRTIVLGSLLAFNATAVRAGSKGPEATPAPKAPAATQPSAPINLSLPLPSTQPLATQPAAPINLALPPAATQPSTLADPATPAAAAPQANPIALALHTATSSEEVQSVVRWVTESGDNARLPFLLIDKVNARVFVFDSTGQLRGTAPALLGMSRGDRLLAPNSAPMSAMTPQMRITPAGRFVSRLAIDSLGKELLVLDYDAAISLHAVVKGTPQEHRAERLNSPSSQDNRISFGCINVPTTFYSTIVSPTFTNTKGIVYVLPETSPASQLFGFSPAGTTASAAQQASASAVNGQATQAIPASVPVAN